MKEVADGLGMEGSYSPRPYIEEVQLESLNQEMQVKRGEREGVREGGREGGRL